jgi:equilibrative nucleoside transporter 1/2/3
MIIFYFLIKDLPFHFLDKMDSPTISPRVSTSSEPLVVSVDGHNWFYWAFVWLGLGSLLPFNFFITADPYFRYKLHDSTMPNSSASRLELSYENAVTLCASVPNLIATILVTFFYVPYIHKYRVCTSLSGITICLLICFSLIFVNVNQWRGIFFILTMILVMIQGVLCAILLNCFFSLASTLPSRYIQGNIKVYLDSMGFK